LVDCNDLLAARDPRSSNSEQVSRNDRILDGYYFATALVGVGERDGEI
jgi:hypothetical protein